MKRWISVLVMLLLLLSVTACSDTAAVKEEPEVLQLYYCTNDYDPSGSSAQAELYGMELGALGCEPYLPAGTTPEVDILLERYLQGPFAEDLYSPLPEITDDFTWSVEERVLTVRFGKAADTMDGIQKTQAAACLACTMTQLPEIGGVYAPELSDLILKPGNFLMQDDTAFSDEVVLRLYFRDETGRYLRVEQNSHVFEENESMASYVIRQLLTGPTEEGNYQALPRNTRLFWTRVEDGVCTVNLSEEFVMLAPKTHTEARTAVFSVVNTLTELPDLECVQFLCAGKEIGTYVGLDLSKPLYREEPAILTAKEEQLFRDVTLYLPCGTEKKLAPVPVMISNPEPDRLAWDLLQTLIDFKPINGYENPIPTGTQIENITVHSGLCVVRLSSHFALCDASHETACEAVYSVVSTLCQLDDIRSVRIEVEDERIRSLDLSLSMKADPSWVQP